MKRILFAILLLISVSAANSQTTYYWVGGTNPATSITIGTNWNTVLNGSGSSRPSSSGATDILVFDGSNVGGAAPATGTVTVLANGSITCGQMKFVNNASINFIRATSGTSTITLSGGDGEDFTIDAGSSLSVVPATSGSLRFAMSATNTGRVSGSLSMITGQQCRFDNTTSGTPGSFVFTSGSSFTSNITSSSSSYAFGSNSQSAERWVVFEDGAHLYYLGGYSPMGSNSTYSPIDFKPGSTWHHRAANGGGSFFNRKSFGNISVENNVALTADGPIFRINNLTVNAGCSFTTHSSGQTAIMGNIVVDGALSGQAASFNEVILSGNNLQTISGAGTIAVNSLTVANNATVLLSSSVAVENAINVFGKLNFASNQLTGAAAFTAAGTIPVGAGTGNLTAGSYIITGNTGVLASTRGQSISGAGIAANTTIVSLSITGDSIYISNPIVSAGTGVALSVSTDGATLETANTNGFTPLTGSVAVTGTLTYDNNINYIINGATTWPFGVTTSSSATPIDAEFIEVNAPVTVNRAFTVSDHLKVDGKITLRPLDVVRIVAGAVINGTPNTSNYIATDYNSVSGEQSSLSYDGVSAATLLPIGTVNAYLPVTITPVSVSDFSVSVFQGITTNGTITGTAFTPTQKQTVVDAVWNINRITGSGDANLQLGWDAALEGSTFATLPNTDIGLITNNGAIWEAPIGTGDNTTNNVTATVSSFGAFGAGAVAQVDPFVFNAIPTKTYGDADFNGGATSLNTTQPIIYSSNNPLVATINGTDIHIVGAGTSDITASQASDGFYPAASVTRTLTVDKANLTINADDKTRFEGLANPPLTATYTGFVLSETPAVLLTPAVLATTAVQASAPGTYPITVIGATSDNYNITMVNGVLTVQAKQNQTITFNTPATKTYGNANFSAAASSTNNTIPLTYSSSNTSVANISSTGIISITGAGTTNITVSQAGNDGYFPAPSVTRTLTVNKVNLTVRVRDTTKVYGDPNPSYTITYTGFVLGETAANLTTAPTVTTTATTLSAPGYYALTLGGGVSQNYNFVYTNGRLTILPVSGTTQQYMNAFMSNSSTLTVRVFSPTPALGDVVIFDMSGKQLIRKNLFMPAGFINMDIPVYQLPSGIYIVTVKGEGIDLKKTIFK